MRSEQDRSADENELAAIAVWCEQVFGPITPRRLVERAREEMDELRNEVSGAKWTDKAREEAADVLIILSRVPGLMDAVRKKMEINKKREWKFNGDGTGYHVKPVIVRRTIAEPDDYVVIVSHTEKHLRGTVVKITEVDGSKFKFKGGHVEEGCYFIADECDEWRSRGDHPKSRSFDP